MVSRRRQLTVNRWITRAESAGLIYIREFENGIRRKGCGKGFTYFAPDGTKLTRDESERVKSLVIPPAWKDVWISPDPDSHIQATGIDKAGRKQYIYHPRWHEVSSIIKFGRLRTMATLLPRIRRQVQKDLEEKNLCKRRVVAAVIRLLDKAYIRVGHERYVESNNSHGATTLLNEHVELDGMTISLSFEGKSGKKAELKCTDARLAAVIEQCIDVGSDYLFCYHDENGEPASVNSMVVNSYLLDIANEALTAKDFRTWRGSVVALSELASLTEEVVSSELSATRLKKIIQSSVKMTAEALNNTTTVCRQSYIHPGIMSAAEAGKLWYMLNKVEPTLRGRAGLTKDEVRLMRMLPLLEQEWQTLELRQPDIQGAA